MKCQMESLVWPLEVWTLVTVVDELDVFFGGLDWDGVFILGEILLGFVTVFSFIPLLGLNRKTRNVKKSLRIRS